MRTGQANTRVMSSRTRPGPSVCTQAHSDGMEALLLHQA